MQVVMDNAKSCKRAGEILQWEYSKSYASTCFIHMLNLALKYRYKHVSWFREIINEAQNIVKFTQSKQHMEQIYMSRDGSTMVKAYDFGLSPYVHRYM